MQSFLNLIWTFPVEMLASQSAVILILISLLHRGFLLGWIRSRLSSRRPSPEFPVTTRELVMNEIGQFLEDADAPRIYHPGLHRRLYPESKVSE